MGWTIPKVHRAQLIKITLIMCCFFIRKSQAPFHFILKMAIRNEKLQSGLPLNEMRVILEI